MQPTVVVRYVGLLLALLGITMLIWRTASSGSGAGYDTVRLIHIIVALAFIGLFEMAMARSKRENAINAQGRRLGNAGRGLATIALVIGIFLLLSMFLSWIVGDTFSIVVYFHAVFGILAVTVAVLIFSGRYRTSKN